MSGPRSELFLSCDLVGSTSFKQQKGSKWQETFLAFYRQFPQQLGDLAAESGVAFRLWKAIGDELIFTVHVKHEDDVATALRLWLKAMDEYEAEVLSKVGLGTKGGAFIGTFPGPDSEASVPRDPEDEISDLSPVILNDKALAGTRAHRKYLYDYFGPSIDTGFRVISACSPRHFTLAVEVTWALVLAHWGDTAAHQVEDLVFRGAQSFKGVWNGRDYPLFAIDRKHDDEINLAIKAMGGDAVDPNKVQELCKQCILSDGWPSWIYLPSSGVAAAKRIPVDPLAVLREDNLMDGSEKPPSGPAEQGQALPEQPPLGDKAEPGESGVVEGPVVAPDA